MNGQWLNLIDKFLPMRKTRSDQFEKQINAGLLGIAP